MHEEDSAPLPSTLAPQYLISTSAPRRHLQHLQLFFHYLNCFSQHLAVQFKEQNLGINFYREALRKAVNIVEKRLKVRKVLIVKHAAGAEGAGQVPRC